MKVMVESNPCDGGEELTIPHLLMITRNVCRSLSAQLDSSIYFLAFLCSCRVMARLFGQVLLIHLLRADGKGSLSTWRVAC